jgi:hypothetical protein
VSASPIYLGELALIFLHIENEVFVLGDSEENQSEKCCNDGNMFLFVDRLHPCSNYQWPYSIHMG